MREGRRSEAKLCFEEIRKTFKEQGVSDSVGAAWDEVERMFPPLSEEEIRDLAARKAEREAAAKEEAAAGERRGAGKQPDRQQAVAVRPRLPEGWGVVPATAKYREEVEWVRQNHFLAIRHLPSGDRLDLGKCQSMAPSMYAVSLLEWAMKNEHAFFKDVVPRIMLTEDDTGDTQVIRREKVAIEEVGRILEGLREGAA